MSHSRFFFFFNDTATTEIYTLSLHDALPICYASAADLFETGFNHFFHAREGLEPGQHRDRKSTRLNSSHSQISYAVFCLKKKKIQVQTGASSCLYVSTTTCPRSGGTRGTQRG